MAQKFSTNGCLQYYYGVDKKALEQGFGAMAEKNNGSFSDGNAPGAGTSSHA
jgi:hypothetical protein